MRNLQKTLAFFGILATASFGQFIGCANDAENCELNYETCANTTGSSGVMPPPGCTDSPSVNGDVIRSDCAYFVGGAKANDSNTGGETDPFATLGAAIDAAKKQKARVYLCGSVSERVDIPAGVSIFGGFDCLGEEWKYDDTQRGSITPAAPAADAPFQSSVRITGSGKTNLEDLDIIAEDAAFDGGSAISLIVETATVNFTRVKLTAGNGKNGLPGITPMDDIGPNKSDDPTIIGNDGANACSGGSMGNPGGDAKSNPLCSESVGGKGGTGKDLTAAESGDPGLPTAGVSGAGGPGQDGSGCGPGSPGANGNDGSPGMGATVDDLGGIDTTGYMGVSGTPGTKGVVGQGGGGGGGSKGKTNCNGASGGSGGAGGCPGNGGAGGNPGGSSIGIISIGAKLTFSASTITIGNGGTGGGGGGGQTGAIGGYGGGGGTGAKNGGPTPNACGGGNGGRGGNGGTGGGGRGGHSIGIAFKTNAPDTTGATIQTGSAGAGGVGDGSPGGDGASGMTGDKQNFD